MESINLLSDYKSSTYTSRQGPLCCFPLINVSPSYSNPPTVRVEGNKSVEGSDYLRHSPSESFFMEGQTSWLDDLLNEPETQTVHRGHRRSASDAFAYKGATAKAFNTSEKSNQKNVTSNTSIWAQNIVNLKGSNEVSLEVRRSSLEEKFKMDLNLGVSGSTERHEREESSSQTLEGSIEVTSSSHAKPSASTTDTKRAKQQSAHRSRVRKLQYIAELEGTVQVLQATGSKISVELEFLDHQNLILNMENRALKQRLDSLSQEQLIKQLEHEMLERELGRLQTLYRLQGQERMRMHQPQPQNSKHRRTKSGEASLNRGLLNGPVQI